MCLICVDFDRRALNVAEARRALGEMTKSLGPEHAAEVEAKLDEAERAERATPKGPATP